MFKMGNPYYISEQTRSFVEKNINYLEGEFRLNITEENCKMNIFYPQ